MPNVTITLSEETLKAAKAKASQQYRSLSQHVAYLIERDQRVRRQPRQRDPQKADV